MVTKREKNFVSVVAYLHNAGDVAVEFLARIHSVLSENFEKYEIIFVNDASSDSGIAQLKEAALALPGGAVSIVNLSFYQGQEAAMNAGVDLAIGDFVFEFERCSIDYPPETVMDVYRHSLTGFDIVSATNNKGRFASSLFYHVFNRSSSAQYQVGAETFRILSRRAINRIRSMSATVPFRKALYASCGLRVDTLAYAPQGVPAAVMDTREQRRRKEDTALTSLILFTDVAYKLSMLMTVLMMLAAVGGGIYTLVIYLTGQPVPGYTTTMLLLAGCFFGVFAVLAIIIKYLSVLVNLLFRRQPYIIESIEKIAR